MKAFLFLTKKGIRLMFARKITLSLALAFGMATSASHASVVIDQDYSDISAGNVSNPIYANVWNISNYDSSSFVQTFYAGVSGTFAGIRLYGPMNWYGSSASPSGDITVQLFEGNPWNFGGANLSNVNILGSATISAASIPAFPTGTWTSGVYANFLNENILVAAGEKLGVIVSSVNQYILVGSIATQYYHEGVQGNRTNVNFGNTILFQSYVDVRSDINSVPGPTAGEGLTGLLLLTAGLLIARKRWRS